MWHGLRHRMAKAPGIVHVADGQSGVVTGVMSYTGSCQADGDRLTATLTTKRHTAGQSTVFGNDAELELKLTGTCTGRIATYVLSPARLSSSREAIPRA